MDDPIAKLHWWKWRICWVNFKLKCSIPFLNGRSWDARLRWNTLYMPVHDFCFNISNAQKSHGLRSDESGGWDTHSIPVALIFAVTFGYREIWQYPSVPGRWAPFREVPLWEGGSSLVQGLWREEKESIGQCTK
jgi:hypothetical protein